MVALRKISAWIFNFFKEKIYGQRPYKRGIYQDPVSSLWVSVFCGNNERSTGMAVTISEFIVGVGPVAGEGPQAHIKSPAIGRQIIQRQTINVYHVAGAYIGGAWARGAD